MRELHIRGVEVPRDVCVIGFDDIDEASFLTPSLSSIRPDRAAIAQHALHLLSARVDASHDEPHEVRVPHQLVVRESTTRPPRLAA